MTAFLEIYLSSFWSWAGITIGATSCLGAIANGIGDWRR